MKSILKIINFFERSFKIIDQAHKVFRKYNVSKIRNDCKNTKPAAKLISIMTPV